jgi:uncharacterized protein DUF4349
VPRLELVDDRYGKLAEELCASRPVAPAALRAEVLALEPPEPRWTFRWPWRRLVLAVAAIAVLGSLFAAGITGLSRSGKQRSSAGASFQATVTEHGDAARSAPAPYRTQARALEKSPLPVYGPVIRDASRLQRYQATLRLRVNDVDSLSSAAKRAMNLAHGLGGYVASVQYATRGGGKNGDATLVLRVPVGNVQTALTGLASLGTILQQHTGILDVTRRVDREARQIAQLERALANASAAEAAAIRAKLATLRVKQARLLKSARLARITLALTTPAKQAAAAPSRFDRTLADAGGVLLRELEILFYALVVAGPLLLGGAAVFTGRRVRRRSDERLLATERP